MLARLYSFAVSFGGWGGVFGLRKLLRICEMWPGDTAERRVPLCAAGSYASGLCKCTALPQIVWILWGCLGSGQAAIP